VHERLAERRVAGGGARHASGRVGAEYASACGDSGDSGDAANRLGRSTERATGSGGARAGDSG
jgi:hypothetical protein